MSGIAKVIMAGLPVCLGLLCFYGAMTSVRVGKRYRTLILVVGGTALMIIGIAVWGQG